MKLKSRAHVFCRRCESFGDARFQNGPEQQCGYPTGMQTDNEFYKRAEKRSITSTTKIIGPLSRRCLLGPVPLIRTIFLAKDQKRNDYLVFGTDPELDTMPTTKDREQIYKMFEDVFDQWREKSKRFRVRTNR